MVEPRGDLDLAQESLRAEQGGQLGGQDLDRDTAAVLEVLGEKDRGPCRRAPARARAGSGRRGPLLAVR